jgi:hypothetical protein
MSLEYNDEIFLKSLVWDFYLAREGRGLKVLPLILPFNFTVEFYHRGTEKTEVNISWCPGCLGGALKTALTRVHFFRYSRIF